MFTAGTAKISSSSPFDGATRDLTLSTYYDIPIQVEVLSGFASLQKNRYGLGATKKTATRYLWSQNASSDASPVQNELSYAYPGITRRQTPETGTDNVDAGGAGVYDSTMGYTNIQIREHDIGIHMTLDQFADVRIDEIVRPSRTIDEDSYDDTIINLLAEDGEPLELESGFEIPTESDKLWNVPPPSYIRGIKYTGATTTSGTGAGTAYYNTWDDNTKPPSFDDNTAPPSFDAESGT